MRGWICGCSGPLWCPFRPYNYNILVRRCTPRSFHEIVRTFRTFLSPSGELLNIMNSIMYCIKLTSHKINCFDIMKYLSFAAAILLANPFELCKADGNLRLVDKVMRTSRGQAKVEPTGVTGNNTRSLAIVNPNDRQANVWSMINTIEDYKSNERVYSSSR